MKNNKVRTFFCWSSACLLLAALTFLPAVLHAQEDKKYIKEGNELFENKKYPEAAKSYQQALKKNKGSYKANFNLGDAYYKQGKFEDAAQQFQALTHQATSKDTLSKAYHNLGNALLQSKKYEESVNAYKNALKSNPNDEDTRYNLAYAQQMLKQQQQQNKDKKNDKDKKDKDKDKDKKDKNDKNKDKDKDKKDQDKKDKDDQKKKDQKKKEKQQQQPDQISKEDAQRLLDALQNDEKNVQNKAKKEKQGIKVKIEKDW